MESKKKAFDLNPPHRSVCFAVSSSLFLCAYLRDFLAHEPLRPLLPLRHEQRLERLQPRRVRFLPDLVVLQRLTRRIFLLLERRRDLRDLRDLRRERFTLRQ